MSTQTLLRKDNNISWWKVILMILSIFIFVVIIFGLIYLLVKKIMETQGRKVDQLMANTVLSGVINEPKLFKKVAKYKSNVYFIKKSSIAFIILTVCVIAYVSFAVYSKDWGFGIKYTKEFFPYLERAKNDNGAFGAEWIVTQWPVWNTALVKWTNFTSTFEGVRHYFIFFWWIVASAGTILYLWDVQAWFSRYLRIREIVSKGFTKDLVESMKNKPILPINYTPNDPNYRPQTLNGQIIK